MANQDVIKYINQNNIWQSSMLNVGDSMLLNSSKYPIQDKRLFRNNFRVDENEDCLLSVDSLEPK